MQKRTVFGSLAASLCAGVLLVGCGGSSISNVTPGRGASPTPTPSPDVVCTTSIEPGYRLAVLDDATGEPLNSGVTVTAKDGDYTETFVSPQPLTSEPVPNANVFQGAPERVGTYTLRVTKSGYVPYERTGVVVTANECHVNTVNLEARLTPLR